MAKKIYIDSCILICLCEGSGESKKRIMERVFPDDETEIIIHVSDLSRLECRVKPLKEQKPDLLMKYEKFFSQQDVFVANLDRKIFDFATNLRADFGLKTPDALHLSVAINHECKYFFTYDDHFAKVFLSEIKIEIIPNLIEYDI